MLNTPIFEGFLDTPRIGRSYIIKASDLHLVEKRKKAGRPPKVKGGDKVEN